METAPIAEGEIVAGKYRVGAVLGQGGMGVVVAATHMQLEQRVALKFLHAEALRNAEVVARFTREAQAAARIQSVHVARVLDVGELPSGVPYMVMEYLEGEDLERALRRRGPLPIAEAVDLLLEGCEAVAEAHMLGIVHRDLKPANLFLAQYPGGRQIVKVLDFGISKLEGATGSPGLTQAASMFGSPPYMSPEQVRSTRSADVRSDIWSLGVVLYELLTQSTPFSSESVPAIFAAILTSTPTPARAMRADIPPALEVALMCCLEKDPAKRFQDVAPLAAAIAPFGSARSADVAARISRLLSMGNTKAALSATAAVAGAAPAPATAPPQPLSGLPTAPSAPTLPGGQGAPSPPPVAMAPAPAPAPTPVAAPVAAANAAPAAGAPARSRTPAMIALAAVVVVAASGAAYWYGARAQQPAAAVSAPPVPTPAPAAAPAPAVTAAAPAPTTPAASSPEPRHHGLPRKERVGSLSAPSESPPLRSDGAPAAAANCAELLARLSLGETLTAQEASTYARACNKR